MFPDGQRDAAASQFQQGGLHVCRSFIALQFVVQPGNVEQIAPAAFGRRQGEVRFCEHSFQQIRAALCRMLPMRRCRHRVCPDVACTRRPSAGCPGRSRSLMAGCPGRQVGQIADAADVDDDAVDVGMAQYMIVKCGNQRRALPACGDVAAAKVADHGDAGQFGE